jgi:hypothetical protein
MENQVSRKHLKTSVFVKPLPFSQTFERIGLSEHRRRGGSVLGGEVVQLGGEVAQW